MSWFDTSIFGHGPSSFGGTLPFSSVEDVGIDYGTGGDNSNTFGPAASPVGYNEPDSIESYQDAIDNYERSSYKDVRQAFNANILGIAPYMSNLWAITFEKLKQGSIKAGTIINIDGQEVPSGVKPYIIPPPSNNKPYIPLTPSSPPSSTPPDIPEVSESSWDAFARGVKEGWDAGGLSDYKTPLLIAGGVVLLILIIK